MKYIDREAPKSGLASLMAMKGRYGDNNLVHMSDEEINSLRSMGQLTVNPETGLPEAFSLRSILPTVAAIGASALMPASAPMWASVLAPAAAAGTTSYAVNDGNMGAAAFDALLAGAGGYLKGASVGSDTARFLGAESAAGASDIAAANAASAAGESITKASGSVPFTEVIPEMMGGSGGRSFLGTPLTQAQVTGAGLSALPTAAVGAMGMPMSGAGMMEQAMQMPELSQREPAKSGYGTRAAEEIKQNYQPEGLTAQEVQAKVEGKGDPLKFFQNQMASTPIQQSSRGVSVAPQPLGGSRLSGTQYAAEGGSIGPNRDALLNIYLAQGGDVGMFSGLVKDDGTGDGMSDNVEFDVVGDPEVKKAMLSPDEYVIDAHTVAALGNGSTNKGAEVLDGFTQNVRSQAYNKGEQPKENAGLKELMKLQSQYG